MAAKEIWIFLFMVGLLAFSWPLPAVFRADVAAYIFTAWAAFIALVAFFAGRAQKDGDGG